MNKFFNIGSLVIFLTFAADTFTMLQKSEAPVVREKTEILTSYRQENLMVCKYKKDSGKRKVGDICFSCFRMDGNKPIPVIYECNTDRADLHYNHFKMQYKNPPLLKKIQEYSEAKTQDKFF